METAEPRTDNVENVKTEINAEMVEVCLSFNPESSDDECILYPSQEMGFKREAVDALDLPQNVTVLTTEEGCKVYLVGTAHFSTESQEEVIKAIEMTRPDFVMLELCKNRIAILSIDEKTLTEDAKNVNFSKVQMCIKENGFVHGVMHILLLTLSAHVTKQLGMAPGGEFRVALETAKDIRGCEVILGDREIHITLQRALAALNWRQKIKLAWNMLWSKEPISKKDVEKFKQKDFLQEVLKEMTGEFPELSRVFVKERDLYLARSLYHTARPLPLVHKTEGENEEETDIPSVVVGVVGIGHIPGIVNNWQSIKDMDLKHLTEIPKPSAMSITMKWTMRAVLVALLSWGCYKGCKWTLSWF